MAVWRVIKLALQFIAITLAVEFSAFDDYCFERSLRFFRLVAESLAVFLPGAGYMGRLCVRPPPSSFAVSGEALTAERSG